MWFHIFLDGIVFRYFKKANSQVRTQVSFDASLDS